MGRLGIARIFWNEKRPPSFLPWNPFRTMGGKHSIVCATCLQCIYQHPSTLLGPSQIVCFTRASSEKFKHGGVPPSPDPACIPLVFGRAKTEPRPWGAQRAPKTPCLPQRLRHVDPPTCMATELSHIRTYMNHV